MFLYWYFVVLLFIAILKYLKRDRTICYIKLFFFFFEKIDCFVRVQKFRFIEYDVAIIIYVVFFKFQTRKILMKSYFIKYSMNAQDFIFSLFLSAFVSVKVKTFCNQTFWDEQSHFELIFSAIFAWKSMMSLSSMMTTTFDLIYMQRRNNILNKNLSTISHVLWCILFFRLTIHQNVQIFRFVQKYSSSINLN